MAAKPLVLVLDAQTDRLKAALRAGAGDLSDFSKSTEEVLESIQQKVRESLSTSGGDLADRLGKNIQAQLAGWKRSAQNALAMGDDFNPMGGMNSATSAQAAQAQLRLAETYRAQAAAAAQATAANEQEAAALRSVAVSSELAAANAEREAEALRIQSGVLAAMERQMGMNVTAHGQLNQMSGATRNAMRDLSFQVSDVATSLAGGMPPMMVFSQQFGQIVGALQMAGGEGNAFIRFLGGPWGLALSTAAVAIVPLVAHLMEAHSALQENADALEKVKLGDNGLGDAQKVLGAMFDLTTGKLKEQNEMLRLNARLTAAKLRAEGMAEAESSNKTFRNARSQWTGGLSLGTIAQGALANLLPGDVGNVGSQMAAATQVRNLAKAVQAGQMSPEQAQQASRRIDFSGLAVTADAFNQALVDRLGSAAKIKTADAIDKTLDSGKLDASLRNDAKARRPRAGRSGGNAAETEARSDAAYNEAFAQAQARQAEIARQGVTDLEELARLDKVAVDAAREKQRLATEEQGRREKWSSIDIAALQIEQDLAAEDQKTAIDKKLKRDLAARDLTTQENALRLSDQILEMQGQLAPTLRERLAILRQLLANEKEAAILAVKKDVNAGRISGDEGAQRIGNLDTVYATKAKVLERQNAGPLASYRQQLQSTTGDMNTAMEQVQVDGLKGLEDGLTGLISGTASVSDAFKRMATSIIADLARIAIQKAIFAVIGLKDGGTVGGRASGGLLGYRSGGIPGFAGGTRLSSNMISGPGTGTSDSILALVDGRNPIMVSNGEGIVNERAVQNYWPMIDAMNKGTFPKFADGGLLSAATATLAYPKLPSARSLRPAGQTVVQQFTIDAKGAVLANELMDNMQQISARHASAALAAAPGLTQQRMAAKSAQRLS